MIKLTLSQGFDPFRGKYLQGRSYSWGRSVTPISEILLEMWIQRTGFFHLYPSLCPHWEHLDANRKCCDNDWCFSCIIVLALITRSLDPPVQSKLHPLIELRYYYFSFILNRIIDLQEIYMACLYNILEVKEIYSCILQQVYELCKANLIDSIEEEIEKHGL